MCFHNYGHSIPHNTGVLNHSRKSKYSVIPIPSRQRRIIKNLVRQEFTSARTGAFFTGWRDCVEGVDADIILYRMHPEQGSTYQSISGVTLSTWTTHCEKASKAIGFQLARVKIDPRVKISALDYFKLVIIHEFGHALGLKHEHRRANATYDSKCISSNISDNFNLTSVERSFTLYDEYDAESIMSYCKLFYLKDSVTSLPARYSFLSGTDRSSLRYFYR